MDAKKRLLDIASFLFLGTAFIWPLVINIISATYIVYEPDRLVFLILFLLLVFYGITYNRVTVIATFSLIVLFTAVVLLNVFIGDEPTGFVVSIYRYFEHIIRMVLGYMPFDSDYSGNIVWLLTFLLVIFTGVFLKLYFSFSALLTLGAAIFIVNFISDYHTSELVFGVFVTAILTLFMKRMNLMSLNNLKKIRGTTADSERDSAPGDTIRRKRHTERAHFNARGNNSLYALCMVPLCAVICLSSVGLPKPDGNINPNSISQKLMNINYTVSDWLYTAFNPRYFSFRATGFGQGNGLLGGNVSTNNREIMRVNAPSAIKLTGDIQSVYTGTSWEKHDDDTLSPLDSGLSFVSPSPALEYLFTRTLYEYSDLIFENRIADASGIEQNTYVAELNGRVGLSLGSSYVSVFKPGKEPLERPPRFINTSRGYTFLLNPETAEVSVDILGKRTYTIFSPMYYYGNNANFQIFEDSRGALSTDVLLPSNTKYSFYYFPQTSTKLSEQAKIADAGYLKFAQDFLNRSDREIDAAQSAGFYGFIFGDMFYSYQSVLTNLKAYRDSVYENYLQLPETLPERVRELAVSLTEGYANDYDKVKALENYLLQYEYTLRPGFVPEGSDFVDHFLFEVKKGYCTYFATALAVMSRAAGIPSRYAEGFALDPTSKTNGVYSVRNSNAHAWAEMYIQGVGWIQFEATPPFREQEDVVSTAVGYLDTSGLKLTQQLGPDGLTEDREPDAIISPINESAEQTMKVDSGTLAVYFAEAAALGLLIVALILLGNSLLRRHFFRKADKLNNRAAALYYYEAVRRFIRFYGYSRYDHETLLQFAARLTRPENYRFHLHGSNQFIYNMMTTLTKVHFSEAAVSDYELSQIKGVYAHFDRVFTSELSWPKKIYYRYFTRRVY